jgi:hypothetical protein
VFFLVYGFSAICNLSFSPRSAPKDTDGNGKLPCGERQESFSCADYCSLSQITNLRLAEIRKGMRLKQQKKSE